MTAISVPTCTATSVNRPWSCQLVNSDTRTKCPEELIGKNSVKPWTMPIIKY